MSLPPLTRRLIAMDREELRFRVGCEARKLAQRARHAIAPPRWRRSAIASVLEPTASGHVAVAADAARRGDFLSAHRALADHLHARRSCWPISARNRETLTASIHAHFPGAARDAVRRADALTAGRHDLLGYRDVMCGTPPDWQRDPIHRAVAPAGFWGSIAYLDPAGGDHKIIWELNRHQHFRALGRAYWLTGDTRYRDAFIAQLEDWIWRNPPEAGVNWASMLELAFRSLSWTWAVEMFAADSGRDDTPWLVDLFVALDRQLAHIAHNLSRYFSPNTHLSGEALALYAVSSAFPELRRSAGRADLGREILLRETERQIRSDGGHAELSAHYHRYSTDFYLLALLVARGSAGTAMHPFEASVRAQAHVLRSFADADGWLPLIGDDDGGQLFGFCDSRPADASPTLAAAAALLQEPALSVGPASEEVCWILGHPPTLPAQRPGQEPAWPSVVLPETGYLISRTAGSDHLVFDLGPHGFLNGGHAHSDALSVVLTVARQPLLVDPGTATYTMDPAARDRFRSTRMHNTVTIDGRDHTDPRGPFHWRARPNARILATRLAPTFDFAQGTHDAYERSTHVRSVLALHGIGWVIVDQIVGIGDVTADSWWHLHPRWTPSLRRRGVVVTGPDRTTLALTFSSDAVAVLTNAPLAQFAPEYGRIQPASTIRVNDRRMAPFAIAAFIPVAALVQGAAIAAVSLDVDPPSDRWVGAAFTVRGAANAFTVLVASPRADATSDGPANLWGTSSVQTDARLAVVRHDAATSQVIALVGGTRTDVRGLPGLGRAWGSFELAGARAGATD